MPELPRKHKDFGGPEIGKELEVKKRKEITSDWTFAELIKKLNEGKISEEDIADMKKLQGPKEFRNKIEGLLIDFCYKLL